MSLVSQPIQSLFNGVSQQPASLRLPSQAEEQINALGTVATGLRKRPPTRHVARVSTDDLSSGFMHTINRDTSNRFIVVITDGDIRVFDVADGSERTVNFPLGKAYLTLASGSASDGFAAVSVADYTFVVNKTVTVELAGVGADSALPTGFNNYYRWNGTDGQLPDTTYFNAAGSLRGTVQTFTDLPDDEDNPAEGDIYKVAGFDQDSFGSYYVRRTGGVWEETVGPGQKNTFNVDTMPWALVSEPDGSFSFLPFTWTPRRVGDVESNPPPTFVGRKINDVFFYRNRLAFASDENVIFSRAGDFGNFWRSTVTDLLDSDVVDVAVSSTKVSILKHAVPFNGSLMLFADQTQFALSVDELLTPTSVSIDTVTEFEVNTRVRPVGIGNEVYFPTESGNHSRIREYFVQEGDANSTDAADVTAHVPEYLPASIFRLTGNSNEDILFALSDSAGERGRLYVYKFFWDNEGKAQSSWSYWELGGGGTILTASVLDNELFLLVDRPEGAFLERVDVEDGAVTAPLTFDVLLDRRTDVTGVYFSGPDRTVFNLPYDVGADERSSFRVVRGDDFANRGSVIDPSTYVWLSGTQLQVPGDETVGECHLGHSYEMRYTFSEQFVRRGDSVITTGRTQLRTFVVDFTDAAFFKTEVAPYGTDPRVEEIVTAGLSSFSGKTLGAASLQLNSPTFHTGKYAFQVYGNSRDARVTLVNDSHLQSKFQSAEVEMFYHNRARA